jgi:CubicO group peptidase (beta-lactamase class C family)
MNGPLDRRTFLQWLGVGGAGCLMAATIPSASGASSPPRGLPRSLPEAQGVTSSGILDFVNAIERRKLNLHSLMMVRHGQVVAEGWWAPYGPDLRHTLYSLSKSFTSTAAGFAVTEGLFRVEDTVVSHFPDDLPAKISPNLAAMKIKHLLMMGSGHATDALFSSMFSTTDKNWARSVLAQTVEFAPGTHFTYNNACPYLVSAIIQKRTGHSMLEYLKPRLFDPLGIENADWETDSQGINTGAWGLRVKTEDIAKLGLLYLHKGVWNGKRLLPEAWIDEATRIQIANASPADKAAQISDWSQGYGYQFWRCRHDAYRGDGAFGQYCIVIPGQDAVIAITSEENDMQAILNEAWDHLLPALQGTNLTTDESAQAQLKQKLASLMLATPAGQPSSPARSGKQAYSIADNGLGISQVSLAFQKDRCLFSMQDAQGEHHLTCGMGRWQKGETDLSAVPLKLVPTSGPRELPMKIAAGGAWSDPNTFVMFWRFIETAHYESVTCRFEEDNLRVEFKKSLAYLNPAVKDNRPVLVGKLLA